jgi:hypothetical protein
MDGMLDRDNRLWKTLSGIAAPLSAMGPDEIACPLCARAKRKELLTQIPDQSILGCARGHRFLAAPGELEQRGEAVQQ